MLDENDKLFKWHVRSASNIEDIKAELSNIERLDKNARKALSRSILIRHLDVGSCNAEEAELLALSNPIYDVTRCH